MTNPHTDHKIRKSTSANHPATRAASAAAATERENAASSTMIEAWDRVAQKLDEVAGVVREQIQAWQQIHEPASPGASANEIPAHSTAGARGAERVALADQTPNRPQPARSDSEPGRGAGSGAQDQNGAQNAGAPESDGTAAVAESARRLVDTFSRSQDGGAGQAAGLQQALQAIMDFLENQAANAAPKVDTAEIMSRLRNLEEEQQSLQSQLNTNRWGP